MGRIEGEFENALDPTSLPSMNDPRKKGGNEHGI